jgi:HEPN domain-containing protein
MTPCIEEAHRLLRLAERDLQTSLILAAHPEAALSAMCFHAQQSAEKSLKAVLTSHCADFPRTHNLEELAILVGEQQINLPIPARELRRLNPYAVEYRYGDADIALITKEEAKNIAEKSLQWAREHVSEVERSQQ